MRFFFKKTAWVLFFLVLCPISVSSAASSKISSKIPSADSSAPIQIHGDAVDYFNEEQKAVGTGHVTIDYEGTRLEADKITVFMASKKALAEGHVVLTQKGSVFKGERAEYDFTNKIGSVAH